MKRLITIVGLLYCCLSPVGKSTGQEPTVTGNIFSMEWSPDSSAIAIASSKGAWLYRDGGFHQITSGEIYDVTWSYDSASVALIQWYLEGIQIQIWEVSSPSLPVRIMNFTDTNLRDDALENLDWSPTSNLIAASGMGIRIWNADTGDLVHTIQPTEPSDNVQWSPDGNSIASFRGSLTIWESATGNLQHEIEFPLFIAFGSWGNDSQHIAIVQSSVGIPAEIYILDLSQAGFSPIILSSNGLITTTEWKGNSLVSYTSPGLATWHIPTQQLLPSPPLHIGNFALSADGSQIAYIEDKDQEIKIQVINESFISLTPTTIPD